MEVENKIEEDTSNHEPEVLNSAKENNPSNVMADGEAGTTSAAQRDHDLTKQNLNKNSNVDEEDEKYKQWKEFMKSQREMVEEEMINYAPGIDDIDEEEDHFEMYNSEKPLPDDEDMEQVIGMHEEEEEERIELGEITRSHPSAHPVHVTRKIKEDEKKALEFPNETKAKKTKQNANNQAVVMNERELYLGSFVSRPRSSGTDIGISLANGEVRYFERKSLGISSKTGKAIEIANSSSYLKEPISVLQDRLLKLKVEKEKANGKSKSGKLQKLSNQDKLGLVQKYSPKTFPELVNNGRKAREALKWLKSWDSFVFGKPQTQQQNALSSSTKNDNQKLIRNDTRPFQKIMLLSGKPGTGKTTLAHVLARHAGYRVVEVNASDDRTSSSLKEKIINAMEMQSLLGGQGKPNCLIIDEIDGISNSGEDRHAANVLIDLARAALPDHWNNQQSQPNENDLPNTDGGGEDGEEEGNYISKTFTRNPNARKVMHKQVQTRPIICICNDLYAPALKELRKIALNITLKNPPQQLLVSRLTEICNREGIIAKTGALESLCKRMKNDIRGCLNALHIIKNSNTDSTDSRGQFTLTSDMVENLSISEKDDTDDMFRTWGSLFQRFSSRERLNRLIYGDFMSKSKKQYDSSSGKTNFDELYELQMRHSSDFDIITQGLHENFLHLGYNDAILEKSLQSFEWLMFGDRISRRLGGLDQDWSFSGYQPIPGIAINSLCSQDGRPNFFFPSMDREYNSKMNRSLAISDDFRESVAGFELIPSYKDVSEATVKKLAYPQNLSSIFSLGNKMLAMEIFPYLMSILSPKVRPIHYGALNSEEQENLERVVKIMHNCGMTYVRSMDDEDNANQRSQNGKSNDNLKLYPPIEKVATYPGLVEAIHKLASVTKQVIIHEIDVESSLQKNVETVINPTREHEPNKRALHPVNDVMQITEEQNASSTKKARRDFFGRETEEKELIETGNKAGLSKNQQQSQAAITFRFNEGYSNAIRRVMFMRDLLR